MIMFKFSHTSRLYDSSIVIETLWSYKCTKDYFVRYRLIMYPAGMYKIVKQLNLEVVQQKDIQYLS